MKKEKYAESGRSKMQKNRIDRIYFVGVGADLLMCRSVVAGDEEEERHRETALSILKKRKPDQKKKTEDEEISL